MLNSQPEVPSFITGKQPSCAAVEVPPFLVLCSQLCRLFMSKLICTLLNCQL